MVFLLELSQFGGVIPRQPVGLPSPDGNYAAVAVQIQAEIRRLRGASGPRHRPREDLPNIYRRFWRADTSRTLSGNGLGLARVQALVRSYGGTIDCESATGRGTRFSIFLPDSFS